MHHAPILPKDALGRAPRVTLCGNTQALVQQHRGLYSYDDTCIRIRTAQGVLSIKGRKLTISHFGHDSAEILGCIQGIFWEGLT